MNMMSTETILSAVPSLSEADLARAQRELRDGHLLVVPTDTVYGIGADAANPDAVAAVLAAKGRGRQMPPPVLVASVDAIDALCVDVPEAARALARAFWPGGLTLILRARPDLGWDLGETGGTVAVRQPNYPLTLQLLSQTGPLAVTSANLTGQPPATDATQARTYFGPQIDSGEIYLLDDGATPGPVPSTIVSFAAPQPKVLRVGVLSVAQIEAVIGKVNG